MSREGAKGKRARREGTEERDEREGKRERSLGNFV